MLRYAYCPLPRTIERLVVAGHERAPSALAGCHLAWLGHGSRDRPRVRSKGWALLPNAPRNVSTNSSSEKAPCEKGGRWSVGSHTSRRAFVDRSIRLARGKFGISSRIPSGQADHLPQTVNAACLSSGRSLPRPPPPSVNQTSDVTHKLGPHLFRLSCHERAMRERLWLLCLIALFRSRLQHDESADPVEQPVDGIGSVSKPIANR